MPDPIFENPRLVAIYDAFDGQRKDLESYLAIAQELKAKSVLDIGSGTGCFACRLSEVGFEVTGVEPARASFDLARQKPAGSKVRWILGDAAALPVLSVDLATMTGNVAQVFLSDLSWKTTLTAIRQVLQPAGHLVFEARDPAKKAWLEWTRQKTYQRLDIPEMGPVEGWGEVIDVSNDRVSFRWTYVFESDGETLTSESTLRFRDRKAIESSLEESGYVVKEVRDAPDRPGKEFVFIAAPR